jgi:DNA-binding ferritin-like protein (Dps family)
MLREIQLSPNRWADISNTTYVNSPLVKFITGHEENGTFIGKHAYTCRDDILSDMRSYVKKVTFKNAKYLSKLQFGIVVYDYTGTFDKRLKFAQTLLNDVERQLKWKRSKFTILDHVNVCTATGKTTRKLIGKTTRKTNIYHNLSIALLEGSKCWVQNPFFPHIILGTIKQAIYKYNQIKECKAKTMGEMLTLFANAEGGNKLVAKGGGYDYAHLWVPLLKDRKKVFGTFKKTDLFKLAGNYSVAYGFGVHALLYGIHSTSEIYNKNGKNLASFLEKWKLTLKKG